MSGYTVKVRGAIGSAKQREYVCFQCGPFDVLVADPPPDEYECPTCEWNADRRPAQRVVSAPPVHTQFVISVARGPSPKPPPHVPDMMKLGEGQSRKEWREERKRFWRDHDYKRRKAAIE